MLPKEPKEQDYSKRNEQQSRRTKRNKRSLNRKRFLAALGPDAANRAVDEEYSSQSRFRIASLHFHPRVLDTFTRTNDGKLQSASDIPASLAKSLSREGCAFTSLRDTISRDNFHLLDAMNDWGHATINLDKPLMK